MTREPPHAERDDLVTLATAARMLGVSLPTIFVMIDRVALRPVRLHGEPLLRRADVLALRRGRP